MSAPVDPSLPAAAEARLPVGAEADLERRFGGLRRLYGDAGYARLRAARVAVVGLGGVGSWAAEALARSGVAALTLIDLDHVAESNIQRQVQATGATLGAAKVQALAARIADIHPGCEVTTVEAFVDADNWPALLPAPVDALIDACDQVRAKQALAAWALRQSALAFVCVGAAGGKREPARVEVADLGAASHDPLLASLRQRLRQASRRAAADDGLSGEGQASASGSGANVALVTSPARGKGRAGQGEGVAPIGVTCVFSREPVALPPQVADACDVDAGLNCHGYGSSVAVTATFGFVAAGEVMAKLAILRASASGVVSSVGRAADF